MSAERGSHTEPAKLAAKKERKETAALSSKELLESLKPEKIVDSEGIERIAYTFTTASDVPVKVVFYNREEMPFADSLMSGHQAFVLGEKPRHRNGEEWENYLEQVRVKSVRGVAEQRNNPGSLSPETAKQQAVFFVEQNPKSLLSLATLLGTGNKEMESMQLTLTNKRTDEKINNLVDQVIAAKMLNDDGAFKDVSDTEGEALMTLTLQGDAQAGMILKKKQLMLKEADALQNEPKRREEQKSVEENLRNTEALKINELVVVHMTNYKPQKNSAGDAWELQTTFQATDGKNPRSTQHFTLNHAVTSAGLYGSWHDTPMAVILPFDKMMEANGKPTVLNTIDTFWERGPGERTVLPRESAYLVKPGTFVEPGELSKTDGHEITYKSGNYQPADVTAVLSGMREFLRQRFSEDITKDLLEIFVPYNYVQSKHVPIVTEDEFAKIMNELNFTGSFTYYHEKKEAASADHGVLKVLEERTGPEFIDSLLQKAGIQNKLGRETIAALERVIETHIFRQVKKLVINKQIEKMGYEVHNGGMWAWDNDSWAATAQTRKLGAELDVNVVPHSAHVSYDAESMLSRYLGDLEDKTIDAAGFHKSMQGVAKNFFADLSPRMRRLFYEVGAL